MVIPDCLCGMSHAQPVVTGNDLLEAIEAFDQMPTHERGDLLVYAKRISRRLTAASFDEFLARSNAIGDRIQALVHIVDSRELDPWIETSSIRDSIMLAEILDVAAVAKLRHRNAEPFFDMDDFFRLLIARLPASFAK
jgi:hypothetical protein